VSVFRPSARVRAPDGTDWEIYAYRLRVVRRSESRRRIARLAATAREAIRSVFSDEWTIQAVSNLSRESYAWRTTSEHKGQVLAQVEGSLARGDPPTSLRNAVYAGWRRSAR